MKEITWVFEECILQEKTDIFDRAILNEGAVSLPWNDEWTGEKYFSRLKGLVIFYGSLNVAQIVQKFWKPAGFFSEKAFL